jgi:hypothetical protein
MRRMGRGWAGACSRTTVDLSSLSLIGAMRRVGRGWAGAWSRTPLDLPELGTHSFFRGSLSAPHSIFSPGSLTLMRSFFEFPFSLVAQTLLAQPVVR